MSVCFCPSLFISPFSLSLVPAPFFCVLSLSLSLSRRRPVPRNCAAGRLSTGAYLILRTPTHDEHVSPELSPLPHSLSFGSVFQPSPSPDPPLSDKEEHTSDMHGATVGKFCEGTLRLSEVQVSDCRVPRLATLRCLVELSLRQIYCRVRNYYLFILKRALSCNSRR